MITQARNFAKNKYTAVLLMSVMKHAIKIYVICKMALFLPLIIKDTIWTRCDAEHYNGPF